METFNILYSTSFSDFENLTNMIDSLVEVDTKGNVVPAIAESWETNDHGQHPVIGGTGQHGSKQIEDMNIVHFFGTL